MTTQIPDIVVYRNCEYEIAGVSGEGLLTPIIFGISLYMMSTACYRGYICKYEFRDDRLYLTEMDIRTADDQYPVIEGVPAHIVDEVIGQYYGLQIFCKLSGGIILVRDQLRKCAVVCNPSCFRTVIEIIVTNGQVEEVIDHSGAMQDIRRRIKEVKVIDPKDRWRIEQEIEWSFAPGYKEQPLIFADSNPKHITSLPTTRPPPDQLLRNAL